MDMFLDRLSRRLKPIIQQAIQEAVHKFPCNCAYTACRSSSSMIQEVVKFRLCFQESWQDRLLTDGKIKVGTKIPFRVVIKDANSNIIMSGPLSSIRIKVVVLNADFGSDGREEWTEEEFASHILSAREGKEVLLKVDMKNINLTNGVSRMIHATITDNSSWTKSKKFRLGATAESGHPEERVLEAISEAFEVKDCRVTLKGQPLSLYDEVHCLKNIAKNGPYQKKLVGSGINTVQDFLRSLSMDPVGLHNILGSRMGKEKWKETEKHASGCILDNKHYSYCFAELGIVLVFNCIYELIGVKKDDCYHPLDKLTTAEKDKVNELKEIAYKNAEDIAKIQDTLVSSLLRPPPALVVTPIRGSSSSDPPIPTIPVFCGEPSEVGLQHPSQGPRVGELYQQRHSYTRDGFDLVNQFGNESAEDKVNELKEIAYKSAGDIAEIHDTLVTSLLRSPPELVVTPVRESSSSDPQNPNSPAIFCGEPSEVGLQYSSHALRVGELSQQKCSYTRHGFDSVNQFGSLLNEENSEVFLTSLFNATTIPAPSSSSAFPDVSAIYDAAPVDFQHQWPAASSQSSFDPFFSPEGQILGCDFPSSGGDSEAWYRLLDLPAGETNTACASDLPALSSTSLSLRKWVNLMTVLRWKSAFKRKLSASRGARVVRSGHQSVALCV